MAGLDRIDGKTSIDISEDCPACHGTGQPGGIWGGPELGVCSFCLGSGKRTPRLVPRMPAGEQLDFIREALAKEEERLKQKSKFPSDNVTDRSLMSGRVRRYHTWPVLKEQTVGDHCWGVYHVYWRIFGVPSAEVGLFINIHDSDELVIGDNPFPMSMRYPSLKAVKVEMGRDARVQLQLPDDSVIGHFDAKEIARIKICDLLEMMQFGMQEREMGNLLATPIIERTRAAALEVAKGLEFTERQKVNEWVMMESQRHERLLGKGGSTL